MDRIVKIPYTPHIGQALLHKDNHRFKTIACGRRWGKTIFAVNEIIKQCILEPGQYWYLAPTYKQAKLIAWEMFKKYAISDLLAKKPNESELNLEIVNGAVIRLMGADNPDSLRGVGLQGIVLDEFADIKRTVWTTIVRPMLSDTKGWATFLGTPKGKINHLYEHFIRDKEFFDRDYRTPENSKIEIDSDFKSFKFKTVDNPYIDSVEIEKARMELAPQYFKQEYEASFEDYTGIIYKEFDSSKHIISIGHIEAATGKKFIQDWWTIFVGIDTGRTTAVGFVAIDEKGRKYIFDEIYDRDGLVKDISFLIRKKLTDWGIRHPVNFIIDSASQVKREYENNGIVSTDSEKDIDNQIAQVRHAFSNNTLFFNSDKCPMHIVEHKGYVWNEKSREPKPLKENDHTCNEIQYIFSTYTLVPSRNHEAEEAAKKTLAWMNANPHEDIEIGKLS